MGTKTTIWNSKSPVRYEIWSFWEMALNNSLINMDLCGVHYPLNIYVRCRQFHLKHFLCRLAMLAQNYLMGC